jgi:hypothetical protein
VRIGAPKRGAFYAQSDTPDGLRRSTVATSGGGDNSYRVKMGQRMLRSKQEILDAVAGRRPGETI